MKSKSNQPTKKVIIVGGGMIGALEALYTHLEAKKEGEKVRLH